MKSYNYKDERQPAAQPESLSESRFATINSMIEMASGSLIHPIYMTIRQMIERGDLRGGEKIVQEHMAKLLGTSRTPLVKALHLLEKELLVVNIQRKGMYVREIGLRELIDAFQCRLAFEVTAVRLAAERMTQSRLLEIACVFDGFTGSEDITDAAYQEADRRFHQLLLLYSQNHYLLRMVEMTQVQVATWQNGLLRPPSETLAEHQAIIEALLHRDPAGAAQAMSDHLHRSLHTLESSLQINSKKKSE